MYCTLNHFKSTLYAHYQIKDTYYRHTTATKKSSRECNLEFEVLLLEIRNTKKNI